MHKTLDDYLKTRLSKLEVRNIERDAKLEYDIICNLQQNVIDALSAYMEEQQLGFNDVVKGLGKSPAQLSKILKGKGNMTITTIAQIYAFMGKKVFLQAI